MRLRDRLWNPYIVVFLSSACIMVIELVASRQIAPRLGVSLYTWTAVIGVILAGISLGNYIGGRLADRFASTFLLGLVFALASLGSLMILWLNNDLHNLQFPKNLPLMVWVVGYIAGVYFLPSTILGCVSPIVVKLSLTDLKRSGTTVGKIYAFSSVGSIFGTFLTGFYLISHFGTTRVILMVAGLLMVMGIWFMSDTSFWKAIISVVVAALAFRWGMWFLERGDFLTGICQRETNYFCINVREKEIGNRLIKELVLDRLVHSYSDLEDPTNLVYGYERVYAEVIRPLMESRPTMSAFFIGGGGFTFPRYLEAKLPESRIVVAEIDPGVTETAYQELGLSPDTRIETYNMDARLYMKWYAEPDSFDLIFGDAFNDYSVPYHLTTLEFGQLVDHLLRDDGLYVVNIIDGGRRGHFMRAYVRTLQQVFKYVAVIPTDNAWQESYRTTMVVVASQRPLDFSHMSPLEGPLAESTLQAYLDVEPPLILTDDFVPVDNLLAPVFEDSFRG